MQLLTAEVFTDDPKREHSSFMHDAFWLEGKLWLVAAWLEAIGEGWRTPTRLIRLDPDFYQVLNPRLARTQILVTHSIPRAVLDGHTTHGELASYEVWEAPGMRFPVEVPH